MYLTLHMTSESFILRSEVIISDDTVFSIDSSTGEITLDNKTSLSDYVTSQSLVAYAKDNGTPQKNASATVTIKSGSVRSTWYTLASIVLYCVAISLNYV